MCGTYLADEALEAGRRGRTLLKLTQLGATWSTQGVKPCLLTPKPISSLGQCCASQVCPKVEWSPHRLSENLWKLILQDLEHPQRPRCAKSLPQYLLVIQGWCWPQSPSFTRRPNATLLNQSQWQPSGLRPMTHLVELSSHPQACSPHHCLSDLLHLGVRVLHGFLFTRLKRSKAYFNSGTLGILKMGFIML